MRHDEDDSTAGGTTPTTTTVAAEAGSVFVGEIAEIEDGLAGFHLSEPDADGARTVRAYLCDGLATEDGGIALWFTGAVAAGGATTLTDASGTATLTMTVADTISGSLELEDGRTVTFDAPSAENGSGIYDVTIGADGSYDGRSTRGDVLDATFTDGEPQNLSGSVALVDGSSVPSTRTSSRSTRSSRTSSWPSRWPSRRQAPTTS